VSPERHFVEVLLHCGLFECQTEARVAGPGAAEQANRHNEGFHLGYPNLAAELIAVRVCCGDAAFKQRGDVVGRSRSEGNGRRLQCVAIQVASNEVA